MGDGAGGYDKGAHAIRRMLTEATVRASDKRVRFVGLEAYEEAGGATLRDLFQLDDGGWLTDAGLLDMLVAEKLRDEADAVRAEGWRWVEAAPDFAYGHTWGLRGIVGERVELTDEEQAARDTLVTEQEQIESEYYNAELPDEVDARLGEIETALAGYDERPTAYRHEDLAIAGTFVSIDGNGRVKIERGYVRPEDELPIVVEQPSGEDVATDADRYAVALLANDNAASSSTGDLSQPGAEPEEDEGMKPLSDRLVTELTAHRTLALREAVGRDPEVAFVAALHALCLKLFYQYGLDSCLDLEVRSVAFAVQAPGMADSPLAQTLTARHAAFMETLPHAPSDLWDALVGFDEATRQALFAHCVGLSVNAIYESWSKRPRAPEHADVLAQTSRPPPSSAALRLHPIAQSATGTPESAAPLRFRPAHAHEGRDERGRRRRATMTSNPREDEPGLSPTVHLLDELQLYGYRPGRDDPDPRPIPDATQAQGAIAQTSSTRW